MRIFSQILLLTILLPVFTWADIEDPFDPFARPDTTTSTSPDDDPDKHKTANQLIYEAIILQEDERLLDARTKLLKALKKDPKAYKAHIALADYYLRHVGHYRLSLKYTKRAQELFAEQHGAPPYIDFRDKQLHADLISLLSQVRLNLDNYQGALDALDEYESHGYYAHWLPASKAWILMKLDRLDEAIRVARAGILLGANPGPTKNILGILLSMTGRREESLRVFEDAVRYETSLGSQGSPATPLNNAGEVYKEIFEEDMAIRNWHKAVRLPDGCEHVLPSLNLALMYLEQIDYRSATNAIDGFESCVAQFPLRNGEEHRALVHLARGRIALHTGHVDKALDHLRSAMNRQQWFGKIGTSQEDLQVAVMTSLAQALKRKNNLLRFHRFDSWMSWFASKKQILANSFEARWLERKSRQVLTEELSQLEDLSIRHTDSMLEYPTLGEVLAGFPVSVLERRVKLELEKDKRLQAQLYYTAYKAENLLDGFGKAKGMRLINTVIKDARMPQDRALQVHAMLLKLRHLDPYNTEYAQLAYRVVQAARGELRNHGFQLPVNYKIESGSVVRNLGKSAFLLDNSKRLPYHITHAFVDGQHELNFISSSSSAVGNVKVRSSDLKNAINQLAGSIFQE